MQFSDAFQLSEREVDVENRDYKPDRPQQAAFVSKLTDGGIAFAPFLQSRRMNGQIAPVLVKPIKGIGRAGQDRENYYVPKWLLERISLLNRNSLCLSRFD